MKVIARQDTNDPSREEEGPRATPMRQALVDPNMNDQEKFDVWRDAMSPQLSDQEVRDLMATALQRMQDFSKPKVRAKKEKAAAEGIMSFLKSEPPKKKWDSAKDSRVVSNRKDDEAWIKLLLDKHRRGIELTDREWNSIQQWKLKRDMKGEDAAGVGIVTKQNSTADVGPGTLRKNLKAFNLTK
jgi:hypothetical protein